MTTNARPSFVPVQVSGNDVADPISQPEDDAFSPCTNSNGTVLRLDHPKPIESIHRLHPLPSFAVDVRWFMRAEDVNVMRVRTQVDEELHPPFVAPCIEVGKA